MKPGIPRLVTRQPNGPRLDVIPGKRYPSAMLEEMVKVEVKRISRQDGTHYSLVGWWLVVRENGAMIEVLLSGAGRDRTVQVTL